MQANIRGGGEYGPRWHQAALKEKRDKAYEDFEAVAEDLVARGVTRAERLGCQGGSNGGLLTGNMLARASAGRKLFGAIVCQVPLLDMYRFHKLLAGASWMGEYGDPDEPAEWAYLQKYSPYHNVAARAAAYPPILFTTSTRDDRVHPAHARKMVRKLLDLGKADTTYYYENMEGGHGGAADNKQRAFMSTLAYDFFEQALTDARRRQVRAADLRRTRGDCETCCGCLLGLPPAARRRRGRGHLAGYDLRRGARGAPPTVACGPKQPRGREAFRVRYAERGRERSAVRVVARRRRSACRRACPAARRRRWRRSAAPRRHAPRRAISVKGTRRRGARARRARGVAAAMVRDRGREHELHVQHAGETVGKRDRERRPVGFREGDARAGDEHPRRRGIEQARRGVGAVAPSRARAA